ncbi:ribonuclease T [bacterium]|nr:ribonuclease T [bacterium]
MRRFILLLCAVLLAGAARADSERAGDFDYYVMALAWSPNWCALTGDSRHDPQCAKGLNLTFTLHGLWPQFDNGGHPTACRSRSNDPTRADTAAMADIMGGPGLAWHEWKEHGRCTGLTSEAYLTAMRKAYESVKFPSEFDRVKHTMQVSPEAIKKAFLDSNPGLGAQDLVVSCNAGMIQEVRICLTKVLTPRACGSDIHACSLPTAELDAVR